MADQQINELNSGTPVTPNSGDLVVLQRGEGVNSYKPTTIDKLKTTTSTAIFGIVDGVGQEPNTFPSVPAAITAGKSVVHYTATAQMTTSISQTGDLIIYISPNATPNFADDVVIDTNGHALTIFGDQLESPSIAWNTASGNFILNASDDKPVNIRNVNFARRVPETPVAGTGIVSGAYLVIENVNVDGGNESNTGITVTGTKSTLTNVTFTTNGTADVNLLNASAGRLNNVRFIAAHAVVGDIATIGANCNTSDISVGGDQDANISLASSVNSITQESGASLSVTVSANNACINRIQANALTFAASVHNASVNNLILNDLNFANDNSNNGIKITNLELQNNTTLYGSNLHMTNANFLGGFTTPSESTGSLVNCTSSAEPVYNGLRHSRAGNSPIVGNDYALPSVGPDKDYENLGEALAAGQLYLDLQGNTTETADITAPGNVYIRNEGQYSINLGAYNLNMGANSIYALSGFLFFVFSYGATKTALTGSASTINSRRLLIYNQSTAANAHAINATPGAGVELHCESVFYQVTGNFSSQLLGVNGASYINEMTVFGVGALANTDKVLELTGQAQIERLLWTPGFSQSGNTLTIGSQAKVGRVLLTDPGGTAPYNFYMSLSGQLCSIEKANGFSDVVNTNISLEAKNAILKNADVEGGTVTVASVNGTYIDNVIASTIVVAGGDDNRINNCQVQSAITDSGTRTRITNVYESNNDYWMYGTAWQLRSSAGTAVTLQFGQFLLSDTTANNQDVNLPSAALCAGYGIIVKKKSASNQVDLIPDGAETIDGAASLSLTADNQLAYLVSDGSNWETLIS